MKEYSNYAKLGYKDYSIVFCSFPRYEVSYFRRRKGKRKAELIRYSLLGQYYIIYNFQEVHFQ